VERFGLAGPLAIVVLQSFQVILAPVPGHFVGLASGYLFGPWLGTLYSMCGLLLGTFASVWLVRRYGRPLVERLVGRATVARLDRFAANLGLPALFLAFLLPWLPDDTIALVAGLTHLPLPGIMLAAFLGRLPGVLISAWLGSTATVLTRTQGLAILGATLVIAIPVLYWRAFLQRLMWSLLERITRRDGSNPDATPNGEEE
jgi:uncharacterized membrane protein YdjX (TVP38/TMEM64 family)